MQVCIHKFDKTMPMVITNFRRFVQKVSIHTQREISLESQS